MPLQKLGGARSYVPKEIREKHDIEVSRHRLEKQLKRATSSTPSWVSEIYGNLASSESNSKTGIQLAEEKTKSFSYKEAHRERSVTSNTNSNKLHRFSNAQRAADRKEEDRSKKEAQLARGKVERGKALQKRAAQKSLVRKKTSKGQPLLSARMKGLFSKVEKLVGLR